MTNFMKFFALLLGSLASVACSSEDDRVSEPADLVLLNGSIYTVNEEMPWAKAVAISSGRFVYVGDAEGVAAYIGDDTVTENLEGQFVLPGIIDAHTHPSRRGIAKTDVYMPGGLDHKATLEALTKIANEQPGDDWLRICCFHYPNYIGEGKLGPHKADLDKIFPDRPVWISSSTGHSVWVNSKALEIIGINGETPDPVPYVAYYGRDEDGDLTGWLVEGAGWQFISRLFPATLDNIEKAMDTSLDKLVGFGVTTVYDASNFDYEDEIYGYLAKLDRSGKLPVRYEASYRVTLPEHRHIAIPEMKRLQKAYGGDRLKFRTVKLFMDGITPELASGLIEPLVGYPDREQSTTMNVEELRDWLLELHVAKIDLHVHTIGDLSVRRVLDALEAAQAIIGADFYPRVTVAHLETIDADDWPRFAELGVSANFTPQWHGRPMSNKSTDLLGLERASHVYPANALIKAGANVTFGSDSFDPHDFDPMLGIQVGHNRRYPEEWNPEKGFRPPESEKITIGDLIKGYTLSGAYQFRMEEDLGSIEVGKLADLVVLSDNPFKVNKTAIVNISPTLVIMEGEIAHRKLKGD